MLFYAALIGIPDELIEAAYVDGATAWTVFWRVKFPAHSSYSRYCDHLNICGKFQRL